MAKSKIAKAKEDAGWSGKGPMCCNCEFFKSKIEDRKGFHGWYKEETRKRCHFDEDVIFATGKQSWCVFHQFDE